MLLNISNLSCHYGVIRALNKISITIEENGIYAIIGVNGAGKSTLLNTLCGIVPISEGSIYFQDTDISYLDPFEIKKLGISLCPEGRKIFKSVTVEENLHAGAYILKDKKVLLQNIETCYSYFPRLKERRKQLAGTLSGGEQQMLAISRALMSDPKLLLFDEPSMGLSPILVDVVFEAIVSIHKEKNIPSIIVEQNSEMALSIANYAYVLEVGEITLRGKGKELLESDEVRKKYLGI